MEKLIKEKWYKFSVRDEICYMKFNVIDRHNIVNSSEYILPDIKHGYEGTFRELGYYNFIPINISEIAHLLPKNHPDLQNKIYEVW